jgi:signal transduction histidine kinase/ActR/RegA family two-component response regulator/HAMP domain-containing protein
MPRGEPDLDMARGTSPGTASATASPGRLLRLQTQIGLSLGGLILVLSLVLAVVLSSAAERQVLRISSENLENLSEQMARELSEGMDRFLVAVIDQTARHPFTAPNADVPEMRRALDQFVRNHPEFAYAAVVDVATTKVLAANGGIFEGGSAKGRPTFEQGKGGPYLGDVHDAVRLAELLPKPPGGETLRFLDVAAPILDASGVASRVFAAHVSWQWTHAVRDSVFGPVKDRRGVEIFLVDTTGKVVLAGANDVPVGTSLGSLIDMARRNTGDVAWQNGNRYLTYVADVLPRGRFSGFGWKVVSRQPLEVADGPVKSIRWAFLSGALGLGLTAALIAWIVAGRLTRPLRELSDATREDADPQSIISLRDGESNEELSTVRRAFTRLSASAQESARAAHTQGRQFEVLASSLPQVVWQADASGRLEYVNKDWLRQRAAGEAAHVSDLEQLIFEEDCPTFRQIWTQCMKTGDDLQVRCRLVPNGGGIPRWCDLEAHAVRDDRGSIVRWVGTIFDVHEMVSAAELTEKALGEERAARKEAERLTRMRDEFLATVSHELRSPLSAITGWSEILARKGGGDEMLQKASEVIRRNAMLQARLIDDLLDMTAMLAGKLALNTSPFDMASVVKEATLSHLHAAQKKGVALTFHDAAPAMVDGDPRRISQVLSNLIGNAVKFTEPGGSIDVTLETEGSCVRVTVTDTGRGIASDFLPHVFDRLRQEDASITRKAGGLGLGLAIAKAVVDLHHGDIRADSAGPGAGATFTFTLPLAGDGEEPPARPELVASTDLTGLRALVVDDEPDAREVAEVALASLGATTKAAASGKEALQLLYSESFDFIVSDVGMPEMDGLAFIRKVRSLPSERNRSIPAIALTAFALQSERDAGMRAGFQAYVTKPISITSLSRGIETALGRVPAR